MGLFRTATARRDELDRWSDVLWQIHTGEHDLLIIEDVIPPEVCARVAAGLEDPAAHFDWILQETTDPKQQQFKLLGESLAPYAGNPEGPDLDHYLDEASRFRPRCRELFGEYDYEAAVEGVFRELGGGREIAIPTTDDGRYYTPSTIRFLAPGTEIPVHVGNYFITIPACGHLAQLVDLLDQVSFFVPLQTPDRGGELVVFEQQWGADVPPMTRADRADWDDHGDLYPGERFAPPVGAMLVFNGGRFYHRVSKVEGPRTRWTIGGFASFSKDGERILYWS